MELLFNFGILFRIFTPYPEQDAFGRMIRINRDIVILMNAGWIADQGSIGVAGKIRKTFKKIG